MKYIFSFLLLLALSKMNAQNLQFSQVLTFGITATANNTPLAIVPENKVWKIEYARLESGGALEANNYVIATLATQGLNHFPIWLKAGDVLTVNGSTNSAPKYFISIIEFNIVP
jgi:hypothetical protein